MVSAVWLTQEEVDSIVLDPAEYTESGWYPISDIANDNKKYHPTLRRACQELIAWKLHQNMESIMAKGGSDAELANASRAYLEAKCVAKEHLKARRDEYVLSNEELQFKTHVDVK